MKIKLIKSIPLLMIALMAAISCSKKTEDIQEERVSENRVIYEVFVRNFSPEGNLKGVEAHIPRLKDLGVDVVWLMPIYKLGDTGKWGPYSSPYAIKDYRKIDSDNGTEQDLRDLVKTIHDNGMEIWFDWVANHTDWDCPWITEHPDWYVKDAAGNIVSPSGWSDVAQLDFSKAAVREAMKDAMAYWVTAYGIDGYRCDYADGVPHDFWSDVIASLRASNPDLIMLAESADVACYADGFDMIYDWNSAPTISAVFKGGKPADAVKEATEALAKVPDGKSILRYVFNHDVAAENNVATMYGAPEGIPAAYVVASMLNGTPMIYSSMDVEGLSGKLSFFEYRTLDFSTSLSDEYGKINEAFKASAEVRRGQLTDYSNSSVVCFTRSIPGQTLLVAVNATGDTKTVRTPIVLAGYTMKNILDGSSVNVPYEIELGPYEYTIMMN